MNKNINSNMNKKIYKILVLSFVFVFFVIVYMYYVNIQAESVAQNKEPEDLTIYNSNSGFYEVPLSTNVIPENEKTIDFPTMSITDTMILKDDSSESIGLSVYKLSSGSAILHAEVGDGHESTYDVKSFGIGDFTAIKTKTPYGCSELTLLQCKSGSGYISDRFFSVTLDGVSVNADTVNNTNATSTILNNLTDTFAENSVLIIASSTNLDSITDTIINNITNTDATSTDSIKIILDTINPAESTLILPLDNTPEVNIESIINNTAPVESESVINSDYSNNEEIKNADF